jgi:hypothetical protein
MAKKIKVKIVVDYENNADLWWTRARKIKSMPEELRPLFVESEDFVDLKITIKRLGEIREWCASIDGWDTGPTYAKTALLFQTHGGKRENQTGRPAELGPTTQKGIRFEDTDLVDIDYLRGDLSFAEYVRQAVKEQIRKDDLANGDY